MSDSILNGKNMLLSSVLLFICCAGAVSAQTTAFNYQGKLVDAGTAQSSYQMQFKLFGSLDGADQICNAIENPNVSVNQGVFTVNLDFSCAEAFPGADRFLEISVRRNASGSYTTLNPRQQIASSPYAIHSGNANNANLLNGQPASAYGSSSQVSALQAQIEQLRSELAATNGGTQLWSKGLGGTGSDYGYSVAVDGDGNVFVTGYFSGTVNFGGGVVLTSAGNDDIFIAKYSGATGAPLWSKRFGGTGFDQGRGVAVDGSGDVFVTGTFQTTVNFGGLSLTSAGFNDVFLVKLSGTNGSHVWSKRFGGTNADQSNDLAADGSGNVVIAGNFQGSADFGGLILTSAGSNDIFAAKYSGTNGSHLWSKRFGGALSENGSGIAVDGSENVFVTGSFSSSTIDFGGGVLTNANAGLADSFLTKISAADGTYLWSKQFSGGSDDFSQKVAVDGSGSVFVTGYFLSPTIDLGGGLLTNAGGYDIFAAKYGGDGEHLWSKTVGGQGDQRGFDITVDNSGNAIVFGHFSFTTNLGGATLNSAGGDDILAAKYAGNTGAHLWSRRFGGSSNDNAFAVAADGSGNIFLTGSFLSPTIDFGGGPLTNAGNSNYDIFVAKLLK